MRFNGVEVKAETKMVRGEKGWDPLTGAVSFPIYQSATFRHPSLEETTGYDYSRQNNPTREELEATVAALEGAVDACAFSTGMSAMVAIFELFKPGDHLIIGEDLYGGTYRYIEEFLLPRGLLATYVDTRDLKAVDAARRPTSRAILIETPTNPMMRVSDIQELCSWAKSHSIASIVDNTFLSPYLQQPIKLGADIVVHSGTKFLAGHNDTLAGFACMARKDHAERVRFVQKSMGAVLSAFDSWLVLRGLKTLAVRMDRQQETAHKLAEALKSVPAVTQVYYPGLTEHPEHNLSKKQASGFGAMVSFRVKRPELVSRVLREVKVITFAESLGGVETLITFPMTQTHAAIPAAIRARVGVDETLLRLSVGLEHPDDLLADLVQALKG